MGNEAKIMEGITPQQLTAINLKYGTTAKSLKVLAFSDLSAKALFLSDKPLSTNEIATRIAELIAVRSVSEDLIRGGLEELKFNRRVIPGDNKWKLTPNARREIEREVASSLGALDGVLVRHFPKNIGEKKLSTWFTDAIADFFIYNGDEWVQSVCKGAQHFSKSIKTVDELLDASIEKHGLGQHSNELKNAFRGFLTSSDIADQRYLTSVGFAMFSARLVAADVGVDPIALGELENATFLVDTNFLFALQLEGRRFAVSLETLGRALRAIGVRLVYLVETKEEYLRVWNGRRGQIMKLVEAYPREVVVQTDDGFISTAVARGCRNREDFETFFDSIRELPVQMSDGPKMEILDDDQIAGEIEKAKRDTKLKTAIQSWRSRLKPFWDKRPKSNSALDHDAALIYVSEFEKRSGNRVYILTLDRSLQACCAERVGNHEIPSAIYLEGLIQILAANNAGPELDAANFAPLLTNILLKRCVPPEHMYNAQDLHWLYGLQKNIAGFRPEKIREIAIAVTRARLAGKTYDDKNLHRRINRLYQEEVRNTDRILEESSSRVKWAEEEASHERARRRELEGALKRMKVAEAIHTARWRLVKALLWRIPATIALSAFSFFLVSVVLTALQKENYLDFALGVIVLLGFGYRLVMTPIQEYRQIQKSSM